MKVRYVGAAQPKMVKTMGSVMAIRFRDAAGRIVEHKASDQKRGIRAGDVIDIGDVDARTARRMAADPRFQVVP